MSGRFPWLACAASLALATACGSIPEAEWARRSTLPPAAEPGARQPLLDCTDPDGEGAFCPDLASTATERIERKGTCMTMTQRADLAFFGHRCLAAHALWASAHVRLSSERAADAATKEDPLRSMAAAEREMASVRADHLTDAHVNLDAALSYVPDARHIHRHLVDVNVARVLVDDASSVGPEAVEAARSLARHPNATVADLEDALARAELLDAAGYDRISREMVAALVAGRVDFAAGLAALGRRALREGALPVAAARLDEARALPGAPLDVWPMRIQVALLERDLATARTIAADTEQNALAALQAHPAVLSVLALNGASEASTRAANTGLDALVEPLERVERAVRSKAGTSAAGPLALELVANDETLLLGLALGLDARAAAPTSLDAALAVTAGLYAHGLRAASGDVMVEVVRANTAAGTAGSALDAVRLTAADHLASIGDPSRAQMQLDLIEVRDASWHFVQGYVHATMGRDDAAVASWRETLRLDPGGELGEAARAAIAETTTE